MRFLQTIGHTLVASTILAAPATAAAPDHTHHGHGASRADAHAPIGVMGDHLHGAGEFMLSYRYGRMRMDGNREGTSRVDEARILLPTGTYMVAPTDMDMQMHMFGFMYAPTDWLTLSAMIPWVELEMDHVMANGNRFTTKSDGVGDLALSGLVRLFHGEVHRAHLNLGLGLPTGGIGHRDEVPVPMMGFQTRRLPYPMQIGSGTWDLLPGLTYGGAVDGLSWGAQATGVIRFGENRHGYRLGPRAHATAWAAVPVRRWVSVSARIAYGYTGNIHGADRSLNPAAVPTADPDLRKGHALTLLGGVNFAVPLGPLGSHRFGFEGGAPVYQDLDGPQLETDWRIIAGWQLPF